VVVLLSRDKHDRDNFEVDSKLGKDGWGCCGEWRALVVVEDGV
jgi:hypothetical protein